MNGTWGNFEGIFLKMKIRLPQSRECKKSKIKQNSHILFIYTSLLHSKWWNNSFKDRCSPYNMLRYWSCKIRSERRTCVIPCEDDGKSLESRNMIYNINSCTRTILPVTSLRSLREQCGNFLKLICFYCTILIGNIIFRQQRQLFGLACRSI